MSLPYTHLAVAVALLPDLLVDEPNEYFVGASIPDIRYFADVPRESTHFPSDLISRYQGQASESFLLGYQVHLLVDEVWPTLEAAYRDSFPKFLRNKLSGNRCQIAFEIDCLTQHPIDLSLMPTHNVMLSGLDISAENVELATSVMQQYLDHPSLLTAFDIAKRAGVFPAHRLDDVASTVNTLERYRALKWLVRRVIQKPSAQIFPRLIGAIQMQLTTANEVAVAAC